MNTVKAIKRFCLNYFEVGNKYVNKIKHVFNSFLFIIIVVFINFWILKFVPN